MHFVPQLTVPLHNVAMITKEQEDIVRVDDEITDKCVGAVFSP